MSMEILAYDWSAVRSIAWLGLFGCALLIGRLTERVVKCENVVATYASCPPETVHVVVLGVFSQRCFARWAMRVAAPIPEKTVVQTEAASVQ